MIDYVLGFPSEAAAQADPIIGSYYTQPSSDAPGGWRGDVCLPGVAVTVVGTGGTITDPQTGMTFPGPDKPFDSLWRLVISKPSRDAALDAHAATQLVADRDKANAGVPLSQFILYAVLPLATLATLHISPTFAGSNYPFGGS